MEQLTAVEWLIKQICGDHTEAWKEEIQQALIMEKEQIIDAMYFGIHTEFNDIISPLTESEKYYNETFSNKVD